MIFLLPLVLIALVILFGAIYIDRSNFPQKAFKPKTIESDEIVEDRVGAHIIPEEELNS